MTNTVNIILCVSQECSNIFSTGGGQSLADETKIPFLGKNLNEKLMVP